MDVARPSSLVPSADDCTQACSPSSGALMHPDAESDEWLASERRGCRMMFLWLGVGLALWTGLVWSIIVLAHQLKG
jgi:hypothetical protein